jgi:hypothetical protein
LLDELGDDGRGLGIAILSESMAASHDTRLETLVIDDIQTPVSGGVLCCHQKQC